MTARYRDREVGHGRRLVGVGRTRPGRTTINAAKPLRVGQARCPTCLGGARVMPDGTYRGHGSRPGISCPMGGQPVPDTAERHTP